MANTEPDLSLAEEWAIDEAVAAMARGELIAIERVPKRLQGEVQRRLEETRKLQRAALPPATPGLH